MNTFLGARRTRAAAPRESPLESGSAIPHHTPTDSPEPELRLLTHSCPVDHEAAERAARVLPGPLRRGVYLIIGGISVILGVIGIFVPLWPTTCFLLLAAWCFARSSPRAERWLHTNRLFGRYLSDYRERGVISGRVRATSVATLWTFIGISAIALGKAWVAAFLILVAGSVTLHLYTLPTTVPGSEPEPR